MAAVGGKREVYSQSAGGIGEDTDLVPRGRGEKQ
jgi:hypothetical protein